jgi:L-iditol 2-dehydrogenase
MRVAMYYNNNDIRIEEIPIPKISSHELLLKVMACGICGSDVMEWYRVKKAPLVLGHEVTGEIVAVGDNVKNYKMGDRVFVSHHVPCNVCRYCLNGHHTACDTLHKTNFDPGGFAEYIRVPQINVDRGVYILPDNVSFETGTFIEPLSCVIRGLRMARLKPGQTVLVVGSGISGLLHIQASRIFGATQIFATDINNYKLQFARKFGADAVIHADENVSERLRDLNQDTLADLVVICTSAYPAVTQALQSVDRGGTVLFFAVPQPGIDVTIPINEFWRNEITIMTTYAGGPGDIVTAIELLRRNVIRTDEMITHRLSLAETIIGFKLVADGKESVKVIIKPHG